MLTIHQEWLMVAKTALSFLLGGLIGFERERRGVAAGIRTFGAIAMGACVFSLVSVHVGWPADPSRIASQVVIGVGFIGAGVFFRHGDAVTGLTTAATLWTSAAIGLAIAFNLYIVGVMTTVILLGVLLLSKMKWWKRISRKRR